MNSIGRISADLNRQRSSAFVSCARENSGMPTDEAEVVTHAQQLLDFDWKLKHVVSGALLASVNRPLLRLELAVTTPAVKVESVPYFRRESVEEKAQIAVAEYSKTELDKLISEMEAISQALESTSISD